MDQPEIEINRFGMTAFRTKVLSTREAPRDSRLTFTIDDGSPPWRIVRSNWNQAKSVQWRFTFVSREAMEKE